ncbi:MAG: L-seryl-tRNA(Sec) selenium transferase [Halioglobus sp.]|nr:L-seryl-tRNA(Sec) selenium transferase [Halioglobus sp.]
MTDKPSTTDDNPYRQLPSVDELLRSLSTEVERWGRDAVTHSLRQILTELRRDIAAGGSADIEKIRTALKQRLETAAAPTLKPLFNLTGTVLHTNLGRALLPQCAIDAMAIAAANSSNLEFDLETGGRGERETHVEHLVCELTGAEAATVVNNNAAAVLLVLNSLALGREVPVSRGELVEIGGSFRIPEVMERSGCRLVEVGATNRTHLKDYRRAIGPDTALLMKVHTSNYEVQGFTKAVSEPELAALAHEHQLPFVTDLGSGNLVDFAALGLPPEPTAAQAIAGGADLVTFSGDKLLGGPQAGIVAGRADLVGIVRQNPLKRALRLDKVTLAALAEVLKLYRNPTRLCEELPTLRLLTRDAMQIRAQAARIAASAAEILRSDCAVTVEDCHSQIGSGSLPVETLPSSALCLRPLEASGQSVGALAARLRDLPRPVIGRVHRGSVWLDLRCLEDGDEQDFLEQLRLLHK